MSLSQAPISPPPQEATPAPGRWRAALRGNRLLTGSALLLVSTTIVNIGNYLFNLLMGRWLGPAAFADVSLIITLFLVVTLITATLQTVAARFSAIYQAGQQFDLLASLRKWAVRCAWVLGAAGAALMIVGAPLWMQFFQTGSPWPFVILGVGVPIYFAQGVDLSLIHI